MTKPNWGKSPVDVKHNKPLFVDLLSITDENAAAYGASNWIAAVDSWDYCDGSLLEEMLRRHPVPFELQPVLADIVSGRRTQNTKARPSVPAAHRMYFAAWYANYKRNTIDARLRPNAFPSYHELAEREGKEVIEVIRDMQKNAKKFKKGIASHAEISVDTLENLYELLIKKIKNYPDI